MTPKVRQSIYALASAGLALLGLAQVWVGIDAGTVSSINQVVAGLLTLLGAGAPAVAAQKVNTQRKDGTLSTNPVEQVLNGIPAVIAQAQSAQQDLDRVRQAASDALGQLPVLGPLAQQALNQLPRF